MEPFNARALRRTILNMAFAGQTVHVACAFSIVEILAVLYRSFLRLGSAPDAADRDYLVLSKGHGVMAQYACLHELGWLAARDIDNYFGNGTLLKGLADAHVPGVEATCGSLGHGLSVAAGLALAVKKEVADQRVFAVVGDGEMNEGTIWEALLFSRHYGLDNLIVIVDANGFQAMGSTDEVMQLGSLEAKLQAFEVETRSVDGHDEAALAQTLTELLAAESKGPKAIVARTTKGHGISFMAGDNKWHYTRLTAETHQAALAELA